MKEIILTGYDTKQYKEVIQKEESGGCYLCKRNNEGIYLANDNGEKAVAEIDLGIQWFSVIEDDTEFKYPLCPECLKLLKGFVEKLLFQKEFGKHLEQGEKKP